MKRVLVAVVSFAIFVLEFAFQLIMLLINAAKTIPTIFLLCILSYHNRIQFLTSRTGFFIIEEADTEET